MASKTPRFQRILGRQVSRIDPFAGAAESVLANELEAFDTRRQNELDERARQESFLSGQQAGEEGAEADASERTIRGRAFNRGVLISHQAALQTDIRDNVQRFELEHELDPDGFDAKVEGLLDGLLAEADPRLQPFIKQRAADYSGRAKSRILARQQVELQAEAANDLQRGAEGMFDDATTAAFEGDPLLPEARRQELDTLLTDGVAAGLIEEGAATELRDNFERQVTSHEVIGNFDRLVREQGIDAGADAIGRWQDLKPSRIGLTAEDHAAVTRQMVTLRNREAALSADEASKNSAAARAEHNLRSDRVTDSIKVLRDGFTPDQEQAKQVAEDLAWLTTVGNADDLQRALAMAEDFDIANAIQGEVHRFRRLPAAQRSEDLIKLERSLRGGGASAEQVELLKALRKTDADVKRELDTDPRGYLQREGLVDDPALDFASAATFAESLAARDNDIGQALAGQPVPRLTAAEADQLSQIYEQAEIEERVGLLGVITAGAGEDAEATLQQLDSKGHEQMALLGSFVMEGRGLLAREVMRGQAILASTPGIKPTPELGVRTTIDDEWGGAMSDWPEQRATFLDAAFAKYAELKGRTGDLSDIYEPKLMEQALKAVLPTARYNGRRVAIPAGITEARFDDWTESWDAQTFTQPVGITSELAPLVSHGRANLATGQDFTDSAGHHTILSGSVRDDRLNNGRPTVIPFVYEGRKVSVEEAIKRALESEIDFPSADTEAEATEISKAASAAMDQFVEGGTPMALPGISAEQMLEVVRDDGRLIELGNGRYGIAVTSAASGLDRFLIKADGAPLMLEFPRQVE